MKIYEGRGRSSKISAVSPPDVQLIEGANYSESFEQTLNLSDK